MSLRSQLERHIFNLFWIIKWICKRLLLLQLRSNGDRDILFLHPGPVNRNVDISDEMLKDQDVKGFKTSY